MDDQPIVDTGALVEDLRLCTLYAARVGLLQDEGVIKSLQAAQEAARTKAAVDVQAVTFALNDVVRIIAPITIADLRFGRDPLSPDNQKKSRTLQLWLAALAVFMLFLIGHFMQHLQEEQEALQTVNQIVGLKLSQKVSALRRMVQFEKPLERSRTAYEMYEQMNELAEINGKLLRTYEVGLRADGSTLFPMENYVVAAAGAVEKFFAAPVPIQAQAASHPPAKPAETASAPASAAVYKTGAKLRPEKAPAQEGAVTEFCLDDGNDSVRLPPGMAAYPSWLRTLIADNLNQFCFHLKVLQPAGLDTVSSQALQNLNFLPRIKHKVSLRLNWFLPFFFGVLGSIIFVMRNVASLRTPAMEWFPIIMRILLGGIAGIAIGWFTPTTGTQLEGVVATSLSLPFTLAFLAGYSIDLLFNVMDRVIRTASEAAPARKG